MMNFLENIKASKIIIFCIAILLFLAPITMSVPGDHISFATSYAADAANNSDSSCFWGLDLVCKLGNWIGLSILSIGGVITWMGGSILEAGIEYTILNLADNLEGGVGNAGLGYTIETVWSVVRDICNLVFIAGFLYVGVMSIFDSQNANTKRFLTKIIIGALLINFSLFFTKVIIDFSNFTAVQIYNAMAIEGNISGSFIKALGVHEIFDTNGEALEKVSKAGTLWFYLMGMVLLAVAGFVLAAGGILLVSRFVMLILIMMFSPILFAATIFPATEKYAKDMWHELINYAFFAPAYLFLLLVSLVFLNSTLGTLSGGSMSTVLANGKLVGSEDIIIRYLAAIAFLVYSLQLSKSFGIKGSEMVIKKSKELMGATTLGLSARAGRATFGRLASNMSDSEALKDRASQRGLGGWAARQQLKIARGVGDATFDARGIKAVGGLGLGEARKGGYTTITKEIKEKEEKFAKSLGEVGDDDKFVRQRKAEQTTAEAALAANKDRLINEANEIDKKVKTDEAELARLEQEASQLSLAGSPIQLAAKNAEIAAKKAVIKNAQTLSDHKRIQVSNLQDEAREAKRLYDKEKQRRVLGSTFTEEKKPMIDKLDSEIKKIDKDLEDSLEAAKTETDQAILGALGKRREELYKQRAETKKQIKELKSSVGDGYASVLENSKWYTAFPIGRLSEQEKKAGKELRKATEKKISKTEEEKKNDALVDAIKASQAAK